MARNDLAIIAWKKLSRRSELLALALDAELWFFPDRIPYIRAAFKTLFKIFKKKPRNVIVQLPQGPLLLEALILRALMGFKVIADVHTGFLLSTDWKGLLLNAPFTRLLHNADIVVAHNQTQLNIIPKKAEKKTIVVVDQWQYSNEKEPITNGESDKYLVFPASFADDEPLQEIIKSLNKFRIDTKLYITGNWKRQARLKKYESEKVIFTGFLSNYEFNNLLSESTAIITGTKREYTSLMSAWEAVAYMKPLALTSTSTLRDNFNEYAVFYDYRDSESIAKAVTRILNSKPNPLARKKLRESTINSLQVLKKQIEIKSS